MLLCIFMCCCCFHDVSPLQALMALGECSGPQLSWFGYKRLISLFAHTFYVLFCSATNKRQDGRIPRQSQRRTKNEKDAAAENSPRMPLNSLHIDCSLSSYLIILGVRVRVKVCVRFCHKYVRVWSNSFTPEKFSFTGQTMQCFIWQKQVGQLKGWYRTHAAHKNQRTY